jgi:Ca2+-binding RTX toxin-like protein
MSEGQILDVTSRMPAMGTYGSVGAPGEQSPGATRPFGPLRKAQLSSGSSNNTFDVTGWTGGGSLTGNGGTDTVVAAKAGNIVLSNGGVRDDGDGMLLGLSGITAARLSITGSTGRQISATNFTGRTTLMGGSRNDTLLGGSGSNRLLGDDGNDSLVGGSARDLLIGGTGSDTLLGNGDDDLLIGGTMAYDATFAALDAIMAEWTRMDLDYASRVAHLRGTTSGGPTGPPC